MKVVYSPYQVFFSTFFGGPIAAVYLLWKNFEALGKESLARRTALWGSVLVLATVAILPALPDKFSPYLLPAIFGGLAMVIARQYQMKKEAIRDSNEYRFASFWRVVAVAVLSLAATFVLIIVYLVILWSLGLTKLD
ncbi:MAG: hypothetical protein KDE63_11370 [Novosphingobium sp.]|nr:hypothetical protein [Novosphingobium sp.]